MVYLHKSLKAVDETTADANPIRPVAIGDLPWLLSLASERYPPFDPGTTLSWLAGIINNPQGYAIRTNDAFAIATCMAPAWHPKSPECHLLFLCAAPGEHWQAIRLARDTVRWARTQRCVKWWFSSETDYEIAAIARRLGAKRKVIRYVMDLANG